MIMQYPRNRRAGQVSRATIITASVRYAERRGVDPSSPSGIRQLAVRLLGGGVCEELVDVMLYVGFDLAVQVLVIPGVLGG